MGFSIFFAVLWIIRNMQILWKRLLLSCRIESAKMIFYWKVTARCKMFTFLCFVKHISTLVFMLKIFSRIHQGIGMCLFYAKGKCVLSWVLKGGSVEERLYKKTSLYSKFEFSFSFTLCLPFKELFFSVFQ